jgi:hypothetical protein
VSFIELFAWVVLVVLLATLVAVLVALGVMPGRVARRRGRPGPTAIVNCINQF